MPEDTGSSLPQTPPRSKRQEKSPWYMRFPKDIAVDTTWQTNEQFGIYNKLLDQSYIGYPGFPLGFLPKNFQILAQIVGVSVNRFTKVASEIILRHFHTDEEHPDRIYQGRVLREIQKRQQFTERARRGGEKSAEVRWGNKKVTKDVTKPHLDDGSNVADPVTNGALKDNISFSPSKNIGNKSTYSPSRKRAKRVSVQEPEPEKLVEPVEEAEGNSEPKVRDALYRIFQKAHETKYGAAFIPRNFDFVQLSRLLWDRGEPWVAERWETAVKNYFASPQKTHTLADLSVNFVTFQIQVIDRFNKPADATNGNGHGPKETESAKRLRKTAERWAREAAEDAATANGAANHEVEVLPGAPVAGR